MAIVIFILDVEIRQTAQLSRDVHHVIRLTDNSPNFSDKLSRLEQCSVEIQVNIH
jgi:hypothetical protein